MSNPCKMRVAVEPHVTCVHLQDSVQADVKKSFTKFNIIIIITIIIIILLLFTAIGLTPSGSGSIHVHKYELGN